MLSEGKLATAVRASMAYPFYLTPIPYEGKLLFDGGLYNNFPSDVMYNDFLPDYIIGSNVSSNLTDWKKQITTQNDAEIVYLKYVCAFFFYRAI